MAAFRRAARPAACAAGSPVRLHRLVHSSSAPGVWDAIQRTFGGGDTEAKGSLFGIPGLEQPAHFAEAAEQASQRCERLIDEILNESEPSELTVQKLDLVSDAICGVVDPAELCRHVHHDPKWRDAAQDVFGRLSQVIFRLNAHKGLFEAVAPLAYDPRRIAKLDEETHRVALLLTKEFEVDGGIHLPEAERERVVELHGAISDLCTTFVRNTLRPKPTFRLSPRTALLRLPRVYEHHFPPQPADLSPDELELTADPVLCSGIQQHVPEPHIRRAAYIASVSGDAGNVPVLHSIVQRRHELARAVGKGSFAQMAVENSMAGTPERVLTFLHRLSARIRGRAEEDRDQLLARKRVLLSAHPKSSASVPAPERETLQLWDLEYLHGPVRQEEGRRAARRALQERGIPPASGDIGRSSGGESEGGGAAGEPQLPPPVQWGEFLTLGNALSGIQMIVRESFGVDMVEVSVAEGEGWTGGAGDVRKFVLWHHEEGELGTIYLDLYAREGKAKGAAQYVIRCGRRIHEWERGQADSTAASAGEASAEATLAPMHRGAQARSADYQLPVVALVMSFPKPEPKGFSVVATEADVPLSFGQVTTVFHEFGHALHSLLSRTSYQHVSGTRTALDFVEIPSHLFERFASDPRVLSRFALSTITGEAPPPHELAALAAERRCGAALNAQLQVAHALFDQAVFSSTPMAVACSRLDASGSLALPSSVEEAMAPSSHDASHTKGGEASDFGVPASVDMGMTPSNVNSNVLLREIMRRHSCCPRVPGTSWQGGFTHVVNYGASYYSYLFARANAAAVWESLFADDPLSRDAGERYRQAVLMRGGAADPVEAIERVLGGKKATLGPLLRSLGVETTPDDDQTPLLDRV